MHAIPSTVTASMHSFSCGVELRRNCLGIRTLRRMIRVEHTSHKMALIVFLSHPNSPHHARDSAQVFRHRLSRKCCWSGDHTSSMYQDL
jgi:hypothetical protein